MWGAAEKDRPQVFVSIKSQRATASRPRRSHEEENYVTVRVEDRDAGSQTKAMSLLPYEKFDSFQSFAPCVEIICGAGITGSFG